MSSFHMPSTAAQAHGAGNHSLRQRELDVRQQELKSQREERLLKMIERSERSGNMQQAQLLQAKLMESLIGDTVGTSNVTAGVASQQQNAATSNSSRPVESIAFSNADAASRPPARIEREAHETANEETSGSGDTTTTEVSIKEEPLEEGEIQALIAAAAASVATNEDAADDGQQMELVATNENRMETNITLPLQVRNETLQLESAIETQASGRQSEEQSREAQPASTSQTVASNQPVPKKRQASTSENSPLIRATKKLKLDTENESNVDGKTKRFISLSKYWHVLDQILLHDATLSTGALITMIANRLDPVSGGDFYLVNENGEKKRFSRDKTGIDIVNRRQAINSHPLKTKAIMRSDYQTVFLPVVGEPEYPCEGNVELRIALRKMYLEWLGESPRLSGRYRTNAREYIRKQASKSFTYFFWKPSAGRWEPANKSAIKKQILTCLEQIELAEARRRSK